MKFNSKKYALIAATQSGAAKELAMAIARRQFKRPASTKVAYEPGTLGVSHVSESIKSAYGRIRPRRERRQMARVLHTDFQKFYSEGK